MYCFVTYLLDSPHCFQDAYGSDDFKDAALMYTNMKQN